MLIRHFMARFFDSELVSTPGEWLKVAAGAFATLLSAGILVLLAYGSRYHYDLFAHPGIPPGPLYRLFVRADILSFIGTAMAVTALATLLVWPALFPGRRDLLALAGLPVSPRRIFAAKFAALLALFAGFLAALNLPPAVAFAAVTAGKWQENPSTALGVAANFAATGGGCVFVFFGLLALQGLLLNLLPGRLFLRASLLVQGTLFVAVLGALPLIGRQPAAAAWWPPVWFLRLWEAILAGPGRGARDAVLATSLAAAAGALAYIASCRRHRRLLLESPADGVRSWLPELRFRDPRQQAAFAFIWKTLSRSGTHRLILLAYAGIALGWIAAGALDAPRPSLRDEGLYGFVVVLAPLALAMLAAVGLRYVFSLPVSLEANWVFRIVDREGRAAWLAAVERFVVWIGMAPIFAASLPASAAILGAGRAAAATVLAFFAALVWFEILFRHWRKLPFTCSYLPGRLPVWAVLIRYSLAVPVLAPLGKMILAGSNDAIAFAALFSFLAVVWWRMRRRRRELWAECPLCYGETPEAAVMTLDLKPGCEIHARENAAPQPMFTGGLVASRGLVPQAWAEEFGQVRWSGTFLEDVRYGARQIRRNPLLASVVVLTLTVGIGINASIFTVVSGLALQPHVSRDPASFVRVILKNRARDAVRRASYGEYTALRDQSRALRQLAAWAQFPAFIGEDNSAGSVGMAVSCNFFAVDGADRAVAGRLLTPDDCASPGPAPPAVLSEPLWRARFGSDPRIVGRVIELNNRPVTVAGVAPNGVADWATRTAGWSTPASVWLPFMAAAHFEPGGDPFAEEHLWLSLAGRLAPGASRSAAQAELSALAQRHDRSHTRRSTAVVTTDGAWVRELKLTMSGDQLMIVTFFLAFFNLVLFIACANVGTLLLARATARRREIAVRLSLGAPRIRLVRMLITESLLLAGVAGAASLYLAWSTPAALFRLLAGREPEFPMPPDWHTFAYVAAAVILTGVLAGLAPAIESFKVDISGSLKGYGAMGGARRLQGLLVATQVAMSMVLLVSAALFAQAEDRTLRADPGYQPRKVVVAPLYFPEGTTAQAAAVKLATLAERVRALAGVRSVAFSEALPLFDRTTVEMNPPARRDAAQPVDIFSASPAFFETLGVPLVRGRELQLGESNAVVVSQSLARAFWPRQDPVGKALPLGGGQVTVVGMVRDVDPQRFGGSDNPALYRAWRLHSGRNWLSVRFDSGAARGASAVRAVTRELDPKMLGMARLMQSWIDEVTRDLWNVVTLILMLGLVATVLAASGIYAAVSFAVNQRTRELGIRAALGAAKRDIVRDVLVSDGRPVVEGLLIGLWLSVAVAAALRHGLGAGSPLRLDSFNPWLYAGAALLLLAAAAAAMAGPARRGANADPLAALRCE